MDGIDAQANEILKRELKEKWKEKSYEEIRTDHNHSGFMSYYLISTISLMAASFNSSTEFLFSAETSTLFKLAELDLQKGTTIPELVFSCCKWFPKKYAIEGLIGLGTGENVVESVFNFLNREGLNCLIGLFTMASWYKMIRNEYPCTSLMLMMSGIEQSLLCLIQFAKDVELDLDKILNHTTKSGDTLFFNASIFSERIMVQLLKENVKVNSINDVFETPSFRVRLKINF